MNQPRRWVYLVERRNFRANSEAFRRRRIWNLATERGSGRQAYGQGPDRNCKWLRL